ncbi:hypothetical protein Z517_09174 [Fonsecaea pedrosoi CBS 271.37]|uniref:Zn(2)-C6 fungal-type domain-containing protein n=1 Tax=Fonsecaea pedrosoi CBS 271.37 TaxID=1442368 RepID=A0A0D2GDG2_9EURO|nr:uncharacterized protein Z517_09174 [Fonsecaea pedrosoi CBS 271.37]KIW76730.1 hypothetical protein Z517_09174 [Fonsecaea pedrosoi CBS 271.37]
MIRASSFQESPVTDPTFAGKLVDHPAPGPSTEPGCSGTNSVDLATDWKPCVNCEMTRSRCEGGYPCHRCKQYKLACTFHTFERRCNARNTCDGCFYAKASCDGGSPCGRCTRLKKACEPPDNTFAGWMSLPDDTTALPDETESPVNATTPKRQRDITRYETEMRADDAKLKTRGRGALVCSTLLGLEEAHGVAANAIGRGDSDTAKLRVGEVKPHEDVEVEDDKSEKETTRPMSLSQESDMSVKIKPSRPQSYRRGACEACRKKKIAKKCNHAKPCNNCEKPEHCFYVTRKGKKRTTPATAKRTRYHQVLEWTVFPKPTSQDVLPGAAFTPVGQAPLINGAYNNGAAYGEPASALAHPHGYGYYADPPGGVTGSFVSTPAHSFVAPCSSYQQPVSSFQQPAPSFQQPSRWFQQPNSSFQAPAPSLQQSASSLQQPASSLQQPNSSLAFQTSTFPFKASPLTFEQNQPTPGTMPVQTDYSGMVNTGYPPYETHGQRDVYHQCEPFCNTTDSTAPSTLDPFPMPRQCHSMSIQGFQPQPQYIESISMGAFPPHQQHHPISAQAFPNQQQHAPPGVTTAENEGYIPLYLEEEDDDDADIARPVHGNTAQTSLIQPPNLVASRPNTGPMTYYPTVAAGHLDSPRPFQGWAPSTMIAPSTSIVASTPMMRSTPIPAPTGIIPSALLPASRPDANLGSTVTIDNPFGPAIPNHPIPACHPSWTSMEAWAQAQEYPS